jgi:hypothetical protein
MYDAHMIEADTIGAMYPKRIALIGFTRNNRVNAERCISWRYCRAI